MIRPAALLSLLCCAMLTSCSTSRLAWTQTALDELQTMMTGSFSSADQAKTSDEYYNIDLHMQPIWPDKTGRYLYVEQAVADDPDRPYRQRVYVLEPKNRRTMVSKVYELPEPKRFIGAHEDPSRLDVISPADLIEREGCAVYLKKDKTGVWRGSTKGKRCKSSLRGASYATSRVSIANGLVQSWDQGFDAAGEQVWGATEGGYIFFAVGGGVLDY